MSFTFFIPHPSPGGDTTVNMIVGNTTCEQLSDNVFNWKCLTHAIRDARFWLCYRSTQTVRQEPPEAARTHVQY